MKVRAGSFPFLKGQTFKPKGKIHVHVFAIHHNKDNHKSSDEYEFRSNFTLTVELAVLEH